jgi:HD-GYP domain-containing protein (c-di-GMP phosphodiesterase class II)
MNSREKYLKDNLNTISEVNELLITSFTREDVVTNSLLTLVKHVPYQFVLIGLTEENRLETVNCSGTDNGTIKQCQFNLDALESSVLSGSVKNALEGNRPVIEQFPQGYRCDIGTTRCSCSGCRIITLPLKNNEQEAPIGHLTILSDREEGFEPEEIKRLEKLAIDISMTLHSVRQRGALEALEREKISNYEETILAFVNIIEQRDSYTAGHTIRVAKYCRLIAEVHYDGKGYPALPDYNRESVHLLSYIMAAADAFDAMTTNRIYKSSKSREDAIEEIMRCSGTQFHPDVSLAAFEAHPASGQHARTPPLLLLLSGCVDGSL